MGLLVPPHQCDRLEFHSIANFSAVSIILWGCSSTPFAKQRAIPSPQSTIQPSPVFVKKKIKEPIDTTGALYI